MYGAGVKNHPKTHKKLKDPEQTGFLTPNLGNIFKCSNPGHNWNLLLQTGTIKAEQRRPYKIQVIATNIYRVLITC